MDLRFSPAELAFRDKVRAFVDANLAPELRARLAHGRHPRKAEQLAWQRLLAGRGWGAVRDRGTTRGLRCFGNRGYVVHRAKQLSEAVTH